VYTLFGGDNPVEASPVVTEFLSKGWEQKVGGKLEFVKNPEEIVARSLAHIDAKRAVLGLARYDAQRFGMSGDEVMMRWLKAREMGMPVSPYSMEGLPAA
jgi:hypothetical protein